MKSKEMNNKTSKLPKGLQDERESNFFLVECPDCTSHQVIFSHASMEVECSVCGRTLVESTGGKARIYGEILKKYE